jgi:hypothetical protein
MLTIKLRRNVSQDWVRYDPILAVGEPGFETDTGKLKIGNGFSRWTGLEYFVPGNWIPSPDAVPVSQRELLDHINSLLPHPVYDDGPSLTLLYSNAKV